MKEEYQKKGFRIGLVTILSTILLLSVSYAWFSLTLNGSKQNVVTTGVLSIKLNETSEGINLENAVPMYKEVALTKTPYTFTVTNDGTINGKYTIYLDDLALNSGEVRLPDSAIHYYVEKDGEILKDELLSVNINKILDSGTLEPSGVHDYKLYIWMDESVTLNDATYENESGVRIGKVYRGKLRVEAIQEIETAVNRNILGMYEFDATNCKIGTEETCVETTSYAAGNIIKYKVNNTEIKSFYILTSDDNTITMLQTEDTTEAVQWNSVENNTQGPLTAIAALETATTGWTNVNDQTYTMGTTSFAGEARTGYGITTGYANTYTWQSRTAKARMLTIEEDQTYLRCSISYAPGNPCMSMYMYLGSWWLMNAAINDQFEATILTTKAWYYGDGSIGMGGQGKLITELLPTRAVVIINK